MRKSIYFTLSRKDQDKIPNTFVVDNKVGGDDYTFWIKEFEKKNYDIYFVNWDDYSNQIFLNTYHYNSSKFVEPKKLTPEDAIFLYKQEGFLLPENISRFHRMLDEIELTGALHYRCCLWLLSRKIQYNLLMKKQLLF